jgi:hypothetical protein
MAETPTTALQKLDAALRITVALVGTFPMTAMVLSVIVHGVFGGSDLWVALAPVLLLPCWLVASSVLLVVESGVRAAGWVALVTAGAAVLLHLVR